MNPYEHAIFFEFQIAVPTRRRKEATVKATSHLTGMVKRILSKGLSTKYLLLDSWFTMPANIIALARHIRVIGLDAGHRSVEVTRYPLRKTDVNRLVRGRRIQKRFGIKKFNLPIVRKTEYIPITIFFRLNSRLWNDFMSTNEQQHIKIRIISAIASLIVGTILMCAKFYLYRITLSSAILSDALESIINVVASSFALVSVIIASKPPDESHPYGHGKIEYFSAGFEGALIVLASVGIFTAGLPKIINPGKLSNLQSGLLMLFGVSLVNLFLGIGLIRAGKRTSSLSLVADGKHVLTDVYTSGGVLLGLWLAQITGWYRLDGTIACLVGVNILFSGWTLVKQSFTGLMDASDPELLQRIADALLSNRSDVWIDIHQLRAWRSGNFVHVDFHLILPECYTLLESHQEEKRLQEIIMNLLNGRASVLIHIDPCQKEDCPICHQSECQFRSADRANNESWTLASLIRHGTEKRSHRTAAGDAPKEVSP